MELQDLEKIINTYLNDVEAFGEEGEIDKAKDVMYDFLMYFQSMGEDDFDDDFKTWNEAPYGVYDGDDYDDYNDED